MASVFHNTRKLESKRRHFFSLKNRYGHGTAMAAGPVAQAIQSPWKISISDCLDPVYRVLH